MANRLSASVTPSGSVDSNYPNAGDYYIGVYGTGSLVINGGSVVNTPDYDILGYAAGSLGTLTVTGAGSALNVANSGYFPSLAVGYNGSGIMNVDAGATVTVVGYNFAAGFGAANATGTVNIDGAGSTFAAGEITIGQGSLNLTNGGVAINSGQPIMIVGDGTAAASVSITGAGSQLTTANALSLGYNGSGSMTIAGGGSAVTAFSYVGYDNSTGTVAVNAGGTWTNQGSLLLGYGGHGSLTISGGGQVTTAGAELGVEEPGPNVLGTGTLTVTGVGSSFVSSGNLNVGQDGTGTLNILAGASVTSGILDSVGYGAQSTGMATVNGAGSLWHNTNNLFVGNSGNGTLTISGGGTVQTQQGGYIGFNAGSTGQVNVTGAGSQWNIALDGWVGFDGSGTLDITSGGAVSVGNDGLRIGSGGTGTATVDGAGSSLTSTGGIAIGGQSNGTLTVSNGGSVVTSALALAYGNGNATLNISGGTVTTSSDLYVSWDGGPGAVSTVNLNNGGTLNVNGGAGMVYLSDGVGGTGIVNIGGAPGAPALAPGILNAAGIEGEASGAQVQFNTTNTAASPYYLTQNGAATGAAVGITGFTQIVNNGGYNVLTGTNSTFSGVQVNAGTLGIAANSTLTNDAFSSPAIVIAASGTLANSGGLYNASTFQNGGTVSGSGTFTQTAGTTVNAGQFSQGAMTIDGGSYTQTAAGSTDIATNTIDKGSVIIQGGTFNNGGTFFNSTYLAIDAGATLHTGSYVQTAGAGLLNDGTLDPVSIDIMAGTFGGTGALEGDVNVTGGEIDVGGGAPGLLAVDGSYDQSAGKIVFDISETGGVFAESMLQLDGTDPVDIDHTDIELVFLGGADPGTFAGDGLLNLNTFFTSATGDPFGSDYPLGQVFVEDSFTTNIVGDVITGFDETSGALSLQVGGQAVPDRASALLLLALGMAALAGGRRLVSVPR